MSDAHDEIPHDPAPPEPRQIVPPGPLLVRGLALAGVSVGAAMLSKRLMRASGLLAPVALVALGVAVLAGWGASVQLTGGVQQDDHPWV